VVIPLAAGRCRLDRDAALLFLFHEVRGGFAVVDLTGTVDLPGQLQDAFRRGRLARIDVGKDAYVSVRA
jgi:hypothetical protein